MAHFPEISNASHGERTTHYLRQYAGKHASAETRAAMLPMAENAASVEMLDEIHQMLRHLSGIAQEAGS